MKSIQDISASAEYKKMEDVRQPFHTRAKEASRLTLPQVYPEGDGDTSANNYATPYQSLGARGVNNLANKMILSLFPPATAFFKLGMNAMNIKNSGASEGQVQEAMYVVEKGIINEMETSQLRSVLVEVLKQGIIGGSSLIKIPDTGKPQCFNLTQFGIKRSKSGVVLKIVIKEKINYLELPSDVRENIVTTLTDKEKDGKVDLDVYTLIMLNDKDKYDSIQEVKGSKIKGTDASYKKAELPFIFVPFVDRGEDFGRSYCEDFIGDLQSYEGLRQSTLEAASESARIIYLVKPNSILTPTKLAKAKSGDAIQGMPDDVATLQADKRLDLTVTQQEAEVLRTDLATLFLLDSAVRRNAERVTAEEIRRVSQELEVALGGIYSTLSNVLQNPLVRLYLKRLVKKGSIKNILKDNLELEITTGSAALGRGTEFRSLQTFMEGAVALLGPEGIGKYLNVSEVLSRMAYSLDVNTGELVKSQEQQEQEAAAQQQAQLEQQAVGPAINAAASAQEEQK